MKGAIKMHKYQYVHVDVFTKAQFGGNQLAVVVDGQGLSTEQMQKIAREFNFSESTFILPPEDPEADWKVRIFTPAREIQFAGHPTLGTAYVLAKEQMIKLREPQIEINLEMGVGVIPVTLEVKDQEVGFIQMGQQRPSFGQQYMNFEKMAKSLSIDVQEIKTTRLPIEEVSCGRSYLFVPINSLSSIETMKPSQALVEEIRREVGEMGFFVFSQETVKSEVPDQNDCDLRVQSRMFTIGVGLHEDPATGGASGPLGCYLIKNGVIPPKPKVKVVSEQGYQINRPSTVHIDIGMEDNEIVDVRVGGAVVLIAEGTLFIG